MQIGFRCPDGVCITHEACLQRCRMAHRCVTKPTLRRMSSTREWTGRPSVTQCLKGTMESYLKIVTAYFVSPQDLAFQLAGTVSHENLEKMVSDSEISEVKVGDSTGSGIPDLLEPDEDSSGAWILYDYKFLGSFAVADMLRNYIQTRPVTGEDGKPYILSRGKSKGEIKLERYVDANHSLIMDGMCDISLQINRYRRLLERDGKNIKRMMCQITVRDGGTVTATQRGILDRIYMVEAPRLLDDVVDSFFELKAKKLISALENKGCDEICSAQERWNDDNKCKKYCSVWFACPHGRSIRGLNNEDSGTSSPNNAVQ